MAEIFRPRLTQLAGAHRMLDQPKVAILADPGTGKTAMTLMLIHELKRQGRLMKPALIVAPLRVATSVWPAEIAKWEQFNHITYRILRGKNRDRLIDERADLHIVNLEGLPWLASTGRITDYDTLVIDESSKFKKWMGTRIGILKRAIWAFKRRYILTGTPAPHRFEDLFSQMYLCDAGRSFGDTIGQFRQKYFWNDNVGRPYPNWVLRGGAEKEIYERLAPNCYRMSIDDIMNPLGDPVDIPVEIPKAMRTATVKHLKALDLSLPINAGVEYGLCRQLAGGHLTDGRLLHNKKLEALDDLVGELQGRNVIVVYFYKVEGEAISKKFKAPRIGGGVSSTASNAIINRWNAGKIPMLVLQPGSAGHGLNLQFGGSTLITYTQTDNLDDYYQVLRRLHRPGVAEPVSHYRLMATGSIDSVVAAGNNAKSNRQQAILDAVAALTGTAA